jgi:uncharacterized protein (TIGR04255 family)
VWLGMAKDRPKFDAPPVVETALSVQFASLPGYTTAHAGWFWKEYLEKLEEDSSRKWSQVAEAPRAEDQFERFGAEDIWGPPVSVKMFQSAQSQRVQLIRSDGDRMIQIQDSRFILNWRKKDSAYPTYDVLLPEFRTMLHAFESFVNEAGFGALKFNQWEIVYIDQIKKGEMWNSVRDWGKIFPGLAMPSVHIKPTGDETMSADWRFSLEGQHGRLYISLRQIRLRPSNEEVLNITLLARGPVDGSRTWERGFEIGHEALTDVFLAITSPEAQEQWRKKA